MNMGRFHEKLSNYTLIATSILAVSIGLLDIFFNLDKILFLKEIPQITLLLLGLICLTIGLEQKTSFERISGDISKLTIAINELKTSSLFGLDAQFINTGLEILETSEKLVRDAETQIYILSFDLKHATTPIPLSPQNKNAFNAYAKALKEAIERHQSFDFRMVYSYDQETLSQNSERMILSAIDSFNQFGIGNRARFRWKKISLGFYLLLIDNKHLLIGFSTNPQDLRPVSGIKFSGNSKLIETFNKWYEEFIWTDANPL